MAEEWTPKTELGRKVLAGTITSLDEIFKNGWKIKEPEIVDWLLPGLRSEIIFFGGSPGKGGGIRRTPTRRTVRMHSSGRRFKISAFVVVGAPGFVGLGKSTAKEHARAINKATQAAKLNVIPIKRACGSWECMCGTAHSIPVRVTGKSGSVQVSLMPAPKGLGLAIGDEAKKVLTIAGVKDIWSQARGKTQSRFNYMMAVLDAFKKINALRGDIKEGAVLAEEKPAPPEKKEEEVPGEVKEEKEDEKDKEGKGDKEEKKEKKGKKDKEDEEEAIAPEEDNTEIPKTSEMKINQEAEGVEEKEE